MIFFATRRVMKCKFMRPVVVSARETGSKLPKMICGCFRGWPLALLQNLDLQGKVSEIPMCS